jgi:hypothetical protein
MIYFLFRFSFVFLLFNLSPLLCSEDDFEKTRKFYSSSENTLKEKAQEGEAAYQRERADLETRGSASSLRRAAHGEGGTLPPVDPGERQATSLSRRGMATSSPQLAAAQEELSADRVLAGARAEQTFYDRVAARRAREESERRWAERRWTLIKGGFVCACPVVALLVYCWYNPLFIKKG